jgi:urea-proton symporter
MAALGVLAKIRVPYAHTSLEIIRMRYGKLCQSMCVLDIRTNLAIDWVRCSYHINLVINVFGCASMIMTGSQLIYGVSGMHYVAATILIPLGGMSIIFRYSPYAFKLRLPQLCYTLLSVA